MSEHLKSAEDYFLQLSTSLAASLNLLVSSKDFVINYNQISGSSSLQGEDKYLFPIISEQIIATFIKNGNLFQLLNFQNNNNLFMKIIAVMESLQNDINLQKLFLFANKKMLPAENVKATLIKIIYGKYENNLVN